MSVAFFYTKMTVGCFFFYLLSHFMPSKIIIFWFAESLKNHDKRIIDTLKIDFQDYLSDKLFPTSFGVKIQISQDNYSMEFEKIPKDSAYPISSSKIYKLDDNGRVVEHEIDAKLEEVCVETHK
jgi:hypothetical protein